MKVVTNEKFIKKKARLGQLASLAGIGILVVGLVISFQQPGLAQISFGCLIVGFILGNFGTYNIVRWVRPPRPDQVLTKVLKGLGNKYQLYNYVSPAPHVLLTPSSLLVLTTKNQDGEISYKEGKWRRKFRWGYLLRAFRGEESLGNPHKDLEADVQAVRRFLQDKLSEAEVPLEGIIVFIHPDVDLDVGEPEVPVAALHELKALVSERGKERSLSASQRKELTALFNERAA
jgi:hypothetical protein